MSLDIDVAHRLGAFSLSAKFQADGRVTALFGPSGAGKTTLVAIMAGLIRPDRGRVVVDGTALVDTDRGVFVPKHRRRIGYVFQDARLFPHLSVRHNLTFGRWFARGGSGPRLDFIVDLLGIGHLLDRRPTGLSGGEKSRVAIGRALLARPRLLLMDEPLAALDEARRAELLPYLERLRDEAGVPIVYVSHMVAEVARLATTLILLDQGRVTASGPAREILRRLDLFRPEAGEAGAVLEAQLAAQDEDFGLTALMTGAGEIRVPRLALPIGARLRIRIGARDVIVATARPTGISALNVLEGRIASIEDAGPVRAAVSMECGGETIVASLTRRSVHDLGLTPGRSAFAIIKGVAVDRG
ncbi:MAG TPA: molybdenum ABC transporter ATP-binding protein [Enterovirga sp.]